MLSADYDLNDQDIYLTDIYMLDYYGIKVFFRVCKTYRQYVCVYELKTKLITLKGKKYIMLTKNLDAKRDKTFIVPVVENTFYKSCFPMYPEKPFGLKDYALKVEVKHDSDLYKEACERRSDNVPRTGTFYAYKLDKYINLCWEYLEPVKHTNNNRWA